MTQKKLIYILSISCICLLTLYLLPLNTGNKQISISTALLNPQQIQNVNEIEIFSNGEMLSIYKSNTCWIGTDGNVIFPISDENVQSFLSVSSKIRYMNIVSKNKNTKNLSVFGLDESNYNRLTFKQKDNKILSKLFFGSSNYSGYNIFLTTDKSFIYETENDLYSWLQTSPRQWSDMNIIPFSILGKIDSKDVQRIKISFANQSKFLTTNSLDFYNKVSKLLSLRASKIIPLSQIQEENFIGSIQLEIGNGSDVELKIYSMQKNPTEYDLYYIIPKIKTGTGLGDVNASIKCQYALEISNWTYENLLNTLLD